MIYVQFCDGLYFDGYLGDDILLYILEKCLLQV